MLSTDEGDCPQRIIRKLSFIFNVILIFCGKLSEMIEIDGLVPIQHRTQNPTTIKLSDGTNYSAVPKNNVSMFMAKREHVPEILAIRARVCCGKKGSKFFEGSLINYNLWHYGNRHGATSE